MILVPCWTLNAFHSSLLRTQSSFFFILWLRGALTCHSHFVYVIHTPIINVCYISSHQFYGLGHFNKHFQFICLIWTVFFVCSRYLTCTKNYPQMLYLEISRIHTTINILAKRRNLKQTHVTLVMHTYLRIRTYIYDTQIFKHSHPHTERIPTCNYIHTHYVNTHVYSNRWGVLSVTVIFVGNGIEFISLTRLFAFPLR